MISPFINLSARLTLVWSPHYLDYYARSRCFLKFTISQAVCFQGHFSLQFKSYFVIFEDTVAYCHISLLKVLFFLVLLWKEIYLGLMFAYKKANILSPTPFPISTLCKSGSFLSFGSCLKYHLLRHVSLNYSTRSRFSMLLFAILSVSFIACITNHKDFICLNLLVPSLLGERKLYGEQTFQRAGSTHSQWW